jgi:PAS domain-containing protein
MPRFLPKSTSTSTLSSPLATLSLDLGGHITMANLADAEHLGANRNALFGKRFGLWSAKKRLAPFNEFFKEAFRACFITEQYELTLDIPNRPFRIVEIKASISPAGAELRLVLIDLTERCQAREAVWIWGLQYRELVRDTASAIIRWKNDGIIIFFNEYAQQYFGYSLEEVIVKKIKIIVPHKQSDENDLSWLIEHISNQ